MTSTAIIMRSYNRVASRERSRVKRAVEPVLSQAAMELARQGEADAAEHPVLIGHDEPPAALNDVLITLAPQVPAWFSRFARVAELVGAAEHDKVLGRERYRFYRERGYPLDTHNL